MVSFSQFATGLNNPQCIVFDSTGNLYAACYTNITKTDKNGITTTYADLSSYVGPFGLAFDTNNNLYITNRGQILKIPRQSDGTAGTITVFVANNSGYLIAPYGIVFYNGNLYVADNAIKTSIFKVNLNGSVSPYGLLNSTTGPVGLVNDSQGNMYLCVDHKILKIVQNPDGTGGTASLFANNIEAYAMAIDSGGNLYCPNNNGSELMYIVPTIGDNAGTSTLFYNFTPINGFGQLVGIAIDLRGFIYVALTNLGKIVKSSDTVCFNKGTKILCLNSKFEEEYVAIENLKQGDLVKTYKHGYRKVDLIASGNMYNNPQSKLGSMYKMAKTLENGLTEDLILTAQHSIMVDQYPMEMKPIQEALRILGFQDKLDDKYLLFACLSKDFTQIADSELYYYYHFILQNDGNDENDRYGVYANGILAETPTKAYFLEQCYKRNLYLLDSCKL
jgi:hypothetical protein